MARFIIIFVIVVLAITTISLSWSRFTASPRPQPVEQVNQFIRRTAVGQQVANVLGVSDESRVIKISPELLVETGVEEIKTRVSDIAVTHLSRLIVSKFATLPDDQQQRILEALTEALNPPVASPSQNLPDATQSGAQADNQSGSN